MKVRNNYEECVTNLVSSFAKYFGAEYYHNTIDYIDKILEEKKPEKVLLFLLDGMGSVIVDNTLDENSFFRRHMMKGITTVFPATTTAATTSVQTGLNPCEHGWLGWNTYLAPIDKTITLFLESEKGKSEISEEFLSIVDQMPVNRITDRINASGEYKGVEVSPYSTMPEYRYETFQQMMEIVEKEASTSGKKYFYIYNTDPDATMHKTGVYSDESKKSILERQEGIEQLCGKLHNTLVFVIADHGHVDCENIYLKDYPEVEQMLERTTSIEARAAALKVKPECLESFREVFERNLGKYFNLYDKKDVIDSKLFGTGKQHPFFEEALGDFLSLAEDNNYCLVSRLDYSGLVTQHAGYTDAEIYVPIIMIDCK